MDCGKPAAIKKGIEIGIVGHFDISRETGETFPGCTFQYGGTRTKTPNIE